MLFTYQLDETESTSDLTEEERSGLRRKLTGQGWEKVVNITSYIFAFVALCLFVCWAIFKFRISFMINMKEYSLKYPSWGKNWVKSSK